MATGLNAHTYLHAAAFELVVELLAFVLVSQACFAQFARILFTYAIRSSMQAANDTSGSVLVFADILVAAITSL